MPSRAPAGPLAVLTFGASIGVGACLLFQVQFIIGKQILPWFGGAPAVWTTCMLFFQVLLLAGYGYAHLLSGQPPARQRNLHLTLLGLSAALLLSRMGSWASPITATDAFKPTADDIPSLAILVLLVLTIGLPYLVLSATGPLLQSWYARCFPGSSPYRLYALSNLGSLAGLLSYPFVLEPMMAVDDQGWVWSAGFAVFAVGCGATAVMVGLDRTTTAENADPAAPEQPHEPPPGPRAKALWFLLAMLASVLLLAVTSQISLEVAVIPFLWMLPLALYLLSFVLCFEYEGSYRRGLWIPLLLVCAGCTAAALLIGVGAPMVVQLCTYLLMLLAACMVCHGELVRRKPGPRYLTGFYLLVSAGGAAGGIFTGIIAPAMFPDLWELPLALVAVCVLALALGLPPTSTPYPRRRRVALGSGTVFVIVLTAVLTWHAYDELRDNLYVSRGFFGVLRVDHSTTKDGELRTRLRHGRIIHGFQQASPELAHEPTSYYGPGSGVGLAIALHPRRDAGQDLRLGFVGLGVGTLACYSQDGDAVRYYEINPDVAALSSGSDPMFTYLRDARGQVEVAIGDARINLERESSQAFDILALDAFSSDAIPAHLLTEEAVLLYLTHLRDVDSVIAVHISNRYLDLDPVVRGVAEATGLGVIRIDDDEEGELIYASEWMLLARPGSATLKRVLEIAEPELAPSWDGPWPRWTDTYSNLVEVLE